MNKHDRPFHTNRGESHPNFENVIVGGFNSPVADQIFYRKHLFGVAAGRDGFAIRCSELVQFCSQ
jgi:hypothetical protein